MRKLCIYGCGGMGRELADLSSRINKWSTIIFVDDNRNSQKIDNIDVYTFDEVFGRYINEELEFIVSTGEPWSRKELYKKLKQKGANTTNLIYPEFVLSRYSEVAKGTIIHVGALITVNVHIGYGCLINKHVVIGHDVTIGDYSVLSPNVTVGGDVQIGDGCYFGSGAIIRNGITIGENSIIGMGAVVLKNVPPNSVMVGNPARFLRENVDKKIFR